MQNYDFDLEQASLLRKLKVAEAMQQGGLEPLGPTQSVGGVAIPHHPLQGLAKVAQAYAASRQIQSLDEKQRQLGERQRTDMRSGLERFMAGLEGTTASIPGGEGTDAYGGTIEHKPNPRAAVLEAMASPHEGLRQIGGAYLKNMLTGDKVDLKTLASMSTPESVLANPNNPAAWKPKRELKGVQAGEVLLDAGGNVATPGTGGTGTPPQATAPGTTSPGASPGLPSGPGWGTIRIGGDLYQQTATGLKKLDNAPKVTTNVNTPVNVMVKGQQAGFEAWAKAATETVQELSTAAQQSVKLMTQLNQLEGLTAGGTNAGPTADIATFVQGLANTAGIPVDASKLNNSAAFNSVATQAWAALMQQNGGARGLVKEESEKLAKSLPSLIQTPQGRAQITAVLRQQAQRNIEDAARANAELGKALTAQDPQQFTFGLTNAQMPQGPAMPPARGAVSPGKPSVSNW